MGRSNKYGVMVRMNHDDYNKLHQLATVFQTTDKRAAVECILSAYEIYVHSLMQAAKEEAKRDNEGSTATDSTDSEVPQHERDTLSGL